jgi:hypothetical protein
VTIASATHRLRVGAVDLHTDRPLDRFKLGAFERLPDPATDRLGGQELRHEDVRAESPADLPERRLRDPGHRGQDQGGLDPGRVG